MYFSFQFLFALYLFVQYLFVYLFICFLNFYSSDIPNTSGSESDDSDLEDDPFISDGEFSGSSPLSARIYLPKPRAPVQRRATIPGATTRPTFSIDQVWLSVCLTSKEVRP